MGHSSVTRSQTDSQLAAKSVADARHQNLGQTVACKVHLQQTLESPAYVSAVCTGHIMLPQPYLLGQDAGGVRRLVLDASAASSVLTESLAAAGVQVLAVIPLRVGCLLQLRVQSIGACRFKEVCEDV